MGNRIQKAIWDGNLDALKLEVSRLEAGGVMKRDVNIIGDYEECKGFTALHCAIYRNNLAITQYLLDKGANPNKPSLGTPESDLYFAVRTAANNYAGFNREHRYEIIRLLISRGADVNWQLVRDDGAGMSVLGRAYETLMEPRPYRDDEAHALMTKIIKLLIASGADVRKEVKQLEANIEAFRKLLDDSRFKSQKGEIRAAISKFESIIESLTGKKPVIDLTGLPNNARPAAARRAPVSSRLSTIATAGNGNNNYNNNAGSVSSTNTVTSSMGKMSMGKAHRAPEVINLTKERARAGAGAPAPAPAPATAPPGAYDGMFAAIRAQKFDDAKRIIQANRLDVNVTHKKYGTPLYMAAEAGSTDLVRFLLAAGATVDVVHPRNGETPLFVAGSSHFPEIVKLLLDAGANPQVGIDGRELPSSKNPTIYKQANTFNNVSKGYIRGTAPATASRTRRRGRQTRRRL